MSLKLGTALSSPVAERFTRRAGVLVKRPRSWLPGPEIKPAGKFQSDVPRIAYARDVGRTDPGWLISWTIHPRQQRGCEQNEKMNPSHFSGDASPSEVPAHRA